jgi:luciferase family oxidoreductase group 1
VTALALSVLDVSPVPAGTTLAGALGDSITLAQLTERLGYRRYWVAEHHQTPSIGGTSPEVMVAAVAAATTTIRVGSGAVLLPYRSPLMVAEAFRTLEALFPGRIDLGIGRAAGTDPATEEILRRGPVQLGEEAFPELVADLAGYLKRDKESGATGPELWVLGSSSQSSGVAAYLGLGFSFAHFISPSYGPQIVNAYRRGFRPSALWPTAVASVAVSVVCADTDAEAKRLASSTDLWRLGPEGPGRSPIVAPEEAASHAYTPLERERLAQARSKIVVGDPERVRTALAGLAEDFGADELVVLTVCHDPAARRRSYELLADAFGLAPPVVADAAQAERTSSTPYFSSSS